MGEFSAWLKEQLKQRNISFRQFEADTKIQRSNLTQYTKVKRQPSVLRCNQIADYFAKNKITEELDLDEASKEGTVKIIKTKDGKFQIQKMTKGKFVDIGKTYNSKKEAEYFRSC